MLEDGRLTGKSTLSKINVWVIPFDNCDYLVIIKIKVGKY